MNFSPQKVLDIQKAKKLKFPALWSYKIDGVYCIAIATDDDIKIFSRAGNEYTSLKHLERPLASLMEATHLDVIIFEAAANLPFPVVCGKIRSTTEQAPFVTGYVHDGLTLSELLHGDGRTYKERFKTLTNAFDQFDFQGLTLLQMRTVETLEQAHKIADEVIDNGDEGIVLRDPDATYHPNKRDSTLVKIKRGLSYDLRVLCVKEGKGKYKGMVGYLQCQWKDGKVINVGSGLTDEQRRRWWSEYFYDEIVDKIVQVDAMELSSKGVLRQPIFKGIRFDKTKADF